MQLYDTKTTFVQIKYLLKMIGHSMKHVLYEARAHVSSVCAGILQRMKTSASIILVCHKMIYTCTLYPIQWELAKNEGHSVKLQTILH